MEYTQLLLDIEELNHLFRESVSLSTLLDKTVQMVALHFHAEVCSIYLYDDEDEFLVLSATRGLNPHSIGHVKLRLGEGLVGTALKELRPIAEAVGSANPKYKFIPGLDEERYEAFLAAPITRGIARIGVLVLQREKPGSFNDSDVSAVKVVASQLANIIENAKFLMALHSPREGKQEPPKPQIKFLKGQSAGAGFACGPSVVVDKDQTLAMLFRKDFDRQYTIADFEQAIKSTETQLEDLQGQVEEKLSDVASLIFAAHLVMLKDRAFIGEMRSLIEMGANPPEAVLKIARKYMDIFSRSTHAYLREKVQDVADLITRLVRNLVAGPQEVFAYRDRIVIAQNLFPSDLLTMSSEGVRGVVMIGGGITSHVAILSQSLQIPLVIVAAKEMLSVPDGTTILVDAIQGNVYVTPDPDTIARFEANEKMRLALAAEGKCLKAETCTADGTRVRLMANINLLNDVRQASELGAEGVGLYRTEFPFLVRSDFPSEEEQYTVYRKLVELMPEKPVIMRTLDVGGDKVLSYYPAARENNPMLGMRSLRFCLENPKVFKQQLRAMLRAGAGANIGIMFPMVAGLDELRQAKGLTLKCIEELAAEGKPHNPAPRIGMMVEIPSVIEILDDLAAESDFFSVGTNDFVQYTLAVDRTNEQVAHLYTVHHPAIIRGLKKIADAANRRDIEVGICGDMAHEARYIPFLIGAGYRSLSVGPAYLASVQQIVTATSLDEARQLATAALAAPTAAEIDQIISDYWQKHQGLMAI